MARLLGPDAGSRRIDLGDGRSAWGRAATVYTDPAATVLADIATYDGTTTPGGSITGSAVTVDNESRLPRFWFPPGVDTLYVRVVGLAGVQQVNADYDPRIDADTLAVNVRSFGATGDGVTDDLVALQAALDAVQTGGGVVFVPTGTYVVSGIPQITGNNVIVRGTGPGSKILLAPAAMNAAGTTIGLWVHGASNVLIENLGFDGNFTNIAKNGTFHGASTLWSPVIAEYGATSMKVYDDAGTGVDAATYLKQRAPIRVTDSHNVTIRNCLIENSVSAGILVDATSVNGCTDILITGNRIRLTWDNGVYLHQGVQHAVVSDNLISDVTYNGVSVLYSDQVQVVNNNIRKCGPSDSDSGGIQINGSSNTLVEGNLIRACQFYGIDLLATQETNITGGAGGNSVWASNVIVTGNTVTGCHANDFPTHSAPGVNLFGAAGANIVNNSVDDCDYGISMGSQAERPLIQGNRITRSSSLGINIGNSADIIDPIVRGNFVAYGATHGVYVNAPARVEGNTIVGNNGMGVHLTDVPTGLFRKTDWVLGNTIMDNTDSGVFVNGGAGCLAVIQGNTFANTGNALFTDGVATNASTTFTSATAAFTSADVNAPIVIYNQGTAGSMTATTVASVTNGTTVVLANAAAATQTGVRFVIQRGPAYFTDGATTNVANSVLTSNTARFRAADVGKNVLVYSAGPNPQQVFAGTVATFVSATSVTLSGNAGALTGVTFTVQRAQGAMQRPVNQNNGDMILRDNIFHGMVEGGPWAFTSNDVIEGNLNFGSRAPQRDKTVGTAQVGSGASAVTVTHGLNGTPKQVVVTPTAALQTATTWAVSAVGATTFTVTSYNTAGAATNVGAVWPFQWQAAL